jgi:hypothetical protein
VSSQEDLLNCIRQRKTYPCLLVELSRKTVVGCRQKIFMYEHHYHHYLINQLPWFSTTLAFTSTSLLYGLVQLWHSLVLACSRVVACRRSSVILTSSLLVDQYRATPAAAKLPELDYLLGSPDHWLGYKDILL